MDKATKEQIIKDYGRKDGDVGSTEVQIALLSGRISEVTEHMKKNPKDAHSERGLILMVSKRRKLLKYLNKENHQAYLDICKSLKIRTGN